MWQAQSGADVDICRHKIPTISHAPPRKKITDRAEMEAILNRAEICRLAMADGNVPYVVALNYGCADNCLYIHCAPEGKKIDIIRKNNRVCFEVNVDVEMVNTDTVHKCSTKYKSVIGHGTASIITDDAGKKAGLNVLMAQYSDIAHEYLQELLDKMVIIKVEVDSMTGKQSLD
jgi:nitroimidazol reductase NimA-like FMN-containing flavoprotein (pyridoxamine 5'-phosphate oxidase superfamily)